MIDSSDCRQLLAIAKQATVIASELVRSKVPHTLTSKGDRDFTSDVDITVEQVVRRFFRQQTPDLGFFGEEGGGTHQTGALHWVLDPVDGTINFLHGLPLCAVSLSLMQNDTTLLGVIDMPFLGVQYYALNENGSYANGQRLKVSATQKLNAALVSIDQYTFGVGKERMNQMRHRLLEHLASHAQRVRMIGASSIDLAWTAHGRLDACIMLGNKPWDTSAGVLIAREAGARVLDLHGSNHAADSSATIAVNPSLEYELMAAVRTALANTALDE
ncbi:MAG: inositol monophosphatase family protein [Pseudonocardiaceae bacterium]